MMSQAFRTSLLIMLTLLAVPFGAVTEVARARGARFTEGRARVDETLVWNQVMLDAIVASTLGNPQTIRVAATVNTAMFDAQNSIGQQRYRPIFVTDRAPRGTHRRAAIVQAAYVTLKSFYPAQLSRFDEQRALSLAEFDGDDWLEVQRGIDWGENVANQILAWRQTDGFSDPVPPFTGAGAVVGQWESATGTSMSNGNISFTAPFVLTSNTQAQSAFPRPWATLNSPEYARDFNEVATMGVRSGSARTLDQTHIAFFFNGYATNDYVEAAIQLARNHRTSRRENSRIFALLTIAMHDTSVTVFRAKRDFAMNPADVTWRPILAIPKAALDGNPDTAPISGWVPLITTPNHPEYPASHPGSHGAGSRVLQHFFGDRNEFEIHPAFNTIFPGPPDVQPRHYSRISDMAQEGIDARTYGGMHFRGSSNATARVGAQIADYILKNAAQPIPRR
ncbi:MAG: hypothetical protein DMG11_17290 [Acidobacteria bacterium]|nr:MAG: hypothetical protein DMG11_17290 [Acidobacteriota bacterium]